MRDLIRRSSASGAVLLIVILASLDAVVALQPPESPSRFDALVLADPATSLDVATTAVAALPASDHARAGWEHFKATHGPEWRVHLDRRSGAPMLVEGKGIPWAVPEDATVDSIAATLRPFLSENRALLLANDAELSVDHDASGLLNDDVWQIVFARAIEGVPVAGERYVFTIGHGNLIAFGAPRWSRIDVDRRPKLDAASAQARMTAYMGLTPHDTIEVVGSPKLELVAMRKGGPPAGAPGGTYAGPMGLGHTSALVWRIALRVKDEPGTWVARVDAHTGAIRSFVDDDKYARVKGGVYPISDDQNCPEGCEQPNIIMPFADVTIGASTATATTMGVFNCSPAGSVAKTNLSGQYVRINDTCGAVVEQVTCSADIDLSVSPGTDCTVPAGSSAGNTHAARSNFYQLNRIAEHARSWLPSRTWLSSQLTANVNVNNTCNAVWDGSSTNMFKSGSGCNNTGELAGVVLHEWGHGLDQNDGGDFDNPSEAYGDITAFMQTHLSCIGRGFRQSGSNCGGYGDVCLSCSGVRDQDWDKHVLHTPATPATFSAVRCGTNSGGPCGGAVHCESYIGGETLWDLATRDLPASGLDQATAWQIADKLWYKSRLGSGGNAYNCSLPNSDGCGATTWFTKIRTVDDDDGNLANGTPHAAAIFAAFDRHKIACGDATDLSNQNSTVCPTLTAPVLSGAPGPGTAQLSWTPVQNALSYRILRNDAGCDAAQTRLTLLTGTSFTDPGLVNGMPLYYRIQAVPSNTACEGLVSNCQTVTPQVFAGTIKLDATTYGCSSLITVTVVDGNMGASPTVSVASTTEGGGETVALVRIAPGSSTYRATIATTANPSAADGVLSVTNADTITATYIDANDGGGGLDIQRIANATASCAGTAALPVADGTFGTAMKGSRANPAGTAINVTWDVATCVSADHHIIYGALADVESLSVTGAACDLGTTGSAVWANVPAGDLWFVVVGDDNASTEGSWGTDVVGGQRGGTAVSGQCGVASRDNLSTCP